MNPSELCFTFGFQQEDQKTDTVTCRIILLSSDVSRGMLHAADAVVQGLICNLLITIVIENNNYTVL